MTGPLPDGSEIVDAADHLLVLATQACVAIPPTGQACVAVTFRGPVGVDAWAYLTNGQPTSDADLALDTMRDRPVMIAASALDSLIEQLRSTQAEARAFVARGLAHD